MGKEGESGYIYFIIYFFFFDGIEKKKFILNEGRWKLEEKKRKKEGQLEEGTNGVVVEESRWVVICFVQNWGRKGKVDIFFYNLRRD